MSSRRASLALVLLSACLPENPSQFTTSGAADTAPAGRRGLLVQAGGLARAAAGGGTVELGAGSRTAGRTEQSVR